jgi:hypothetical protein
MKRKKERTTKLRQIGKSERETKGGKRIAKAESEEEEEIISKA